MTETKSEVLMDVTVYNGKYRVVLTDSEFYACRYGVRYRKLTGDSLVNALASEVEDLRAITKVLAREKDEIDRQLKERLCTSQAEQRRLFKRVRTLESHLSKHYDDSERGVRR